MVGMYWGLEVFGQYIGGVVGRGYSPDSHSAVHIILLDFVVTDVNRSGVIGHIRLCSYMLCSLIVRVEVVGVARVSKKLLRFL